MMENNMIEPTKMEICSEFGEIEKIFYSLHCINDNIHLLAEGLAYNEEDENSNALMLCSDTLSLKLKELSECIDKLDIKMSEMDKIKDSEKII